jgi:mono/diheme cytochrome c family protein
MREGVMDEPRASGRGARRWKFAPWLAAVGVAASISGCASGRGDRAAAVARGEALATRACGNCHGLGPAGVSSFPGAPAFRDMRFDYDAISYERSMAAWHLGHVDMPPAEISLDDVRDIGAYVRSLERSGRH